MAVQGYHLEQTGPEVQGALDKIINLSPATEEAPGLMSAEDKAKLDGINPANFATKDELASKVDKETGKGLSTNDYTDEDKALVGTIEGKQDTIQDLDEIRSGAAAGASAYQKPSSGIPGSDLARLRLTGLPLAGEYTVENFQTSYCTLEELAKAANGTYRTASYAGMSGTSSGFTMILPLAGSVNAVFGTFTYTVRIYNDTTVITISWQNTGNTVTVTTASIPDVSQFVTRSVNDLANYYLKSETFTKAEVQNLIGAIQQFHYEIYASRSEVTAPASNVLYLIGPTGTGADKYEEYVYSNGWVKIGDTTIDLSGYVTTQALNAALANYTTTADLTTLLSGKQDVISDLATIRTGAGLGATAYQKPQTGIPASDLASGVIPDVSGKENTSNKVTSLSAQSTNTEYPSAKATYDAINPSVQSSQPAGGFAPNVVYDLGELTGSVTFALAAGVTGKVNAYHWTFDTGSTAPTITWPANIIWPDGFTPSVDASKHYEVLVRNGYASMLVFSLSA